MIKNKEIPMKHRPKSISSAQNTLYFGTSLSNKILQDEIAHFSYKNDQYEQTINYTEDPLWNHVYSEALKVIGPCARKIQESKLGPLSPKDETILFHCNTEEAAQLIQQYSFIFLESLKRYFPSLKELRVEINET